MAILTVNTTADKIANDGKLSLREAVAQANGTAGADTIQFAAGLEGKTLVLTQGELLVTRDLTIDGDRDNDGVEVTISGGGVSRLLRISGSNTDVSIRDLALTDGFASGASGGAIHVNGKSLSISGCTISDSYVEESDNSSFNGGGAIYTAGKTHLSMFDSTINNCTVYSENAYGGGIWLEYTATLSMDNCALTDNSVSLYSSGGAISGGKYLLIRGSLFSGNFADSRGSAISSGGFVSLEDSLVLANRGYGSALAFTGDATITNTSISNNQVGGIYSVGNNMTVVNSTISGNQYRGGLVLDNSSLILANSTVTGNITDDSYSGGISGIFVNSMQISSSLVLGNYAEGGTIKSDIAATLPFQSNGHNIFGSDVAGAIIGDLQDVESSLIFANLDPVTGGGQANAAGIVPLRNSATNPALGGGDPLAALSTDQLGTARPSPVGSLPDIGAAERNQTLSTSPSTNNDVLTGTDGANTIAGKAGADLILGRGGRDVLRGEGGSDVLDGGTGNDLLDGGDGIDLARFGGSTAVVIDLVAGTATRGNETDTLTSIQGAIGSSAGDTFKGDGGPNWFQGGGGKDVATGDAGRDLYDFDRVQDSLPGAANRDVIDDLAPQSDRIDLTGIDADTTRTGNQAFRWIDTNPLTGPGQLGYAFSGGNLIVRGSTDADAAPELEIHLTALTGIGGYAFNL